MISRIDVHNTSEFQTLPLKTLQAYVGSKSALEIINLPDLTGIWRVKKLYVRVSYPDNTESTYAAKKVNDSYICTIPSCDIVGDGKYMIVADVITESGDVAYDFTLGIGDISILDVDMSPSPHTTKWRVNLISSLNDPIKGDMYVDDLSSVIYDGSNWVSIGSDVNLSGYATENFVQDKIDILSVKVDDKIDEVKKDVEKISSDYNTTKNDVAGIKSKIPNSASPENQLADNAFVNSSINNYAAFYLTKDSAGNAFGSFAQLSSATKFYNAGVQRTPTKNDYLVILEDETKTTTLGVNPTTRYTYQGIYPDGQWEYQYIVNNTALTQAQVNAINSGITKDIVDNRVIPSTQYDGYAQNAVNAQNAANADTATYAYEAGYAPDYTTLQLFNQTLGDLSSIIQGI